MASRGILLIPLYLLACVQASSFERNPRRVCALKDSKSSGLVLSDNKTVECPLVTDACFTVWNITTSGQVVIITQGCWNNVCDTKTCVNEQVPKNRTRFCCCHGDHCNVNFTDEYVPQPAIASTQAVPIYIHTNYRLKTIIQALSPVLILAVVTIILFVVIRHCHAKRRPNLDPEQLTDVTSIPDGLHKLEVEDLILDSIVTKGNYGTIWKGTLGGETTVAVKVFSGQQRCNHFVNERDTYTLPLMDHDSVPRFYGFGERRNSQDHQLMLVMAYMELGSLTDFLKHNTIDWVTMCKMSLSTVQGLAHLHTDIVKGDLMKPAVVHRDFNSRNILVSPDLSCKICDFGLAMRVGGIRLSRDKHQDLNLERSCNVGTIRYMAPEVLEGAVNLCDHESALKQIDVYALGLVIWEIASRCSEIYQGLPVPEYQLPYQDKVGSQPSLEEMAEVVVIKKERPPFPLTWKDTNAALRALKETIEDCWDQDGEARLTALCVEERVIEMAQLWDLRNKVITGVTPTKIPTGYTQESRKSGHIENQLNQLHEPRTRDSQSLSTNGDTSSSVTETTVLSPSEHVADALPEKAVNITAAQTQRPLQPHQGVNPTSERNRMKCSAESLQICGNTLVEKNLLGGARFSGPEGSDNCNASQGLTDAQLNAIADTLECSLVNNDLLTNISANVMNKTSLNMNYQGVPSNITYPCVPSNVTYSNTTNQNSLSSNLANPVAGPSNLANPVAGPSNLANQVAGPSNLSNHIAGRSNSPHLSSGADNFHDDPLVGRLHENENIDRHSSEPAYTVRPKQQNGITTGGAYNVNECVNGDTKPKSFFSKFRKQPKAMDKNTRQQSLPLLAKMRMGKNSGNSDPSNRDSIEYDNTVDLATLTASNPNRYDRYKSNLNPRPIDTQVRYHQGATQTCPAVVKQLNVDVDRSYTNDQRASETAQLLDSTNTYSGATYNGGATSNGATYNGRATLNGATYNGGATSNETASNGATVEPESSPKSDDSRLRRPTSLLVSGHNYQQRAHAQNSAANRWNQHGAASRSVAPDENPSNMPLQDFVVADSFGGSNQPREENHEC